MAVGLPDSSVAVCHFAEGHSMNRATARLLANRMSEAVEQAGMPVEEIVAYMLGSPLPPQWKRIARRVQRAGIVGELERLPDLTAEQLTECLAMIERVRTTPGEMRQRMKASLRSLPRKRGGPIRKVSRADEVSVCEEIRRLSESYDARKAVGLVATKRHVSERTIYRILEEHGQTEPRRPKKTAVK